MDLPEQGCELYFEGFKFFHLVDVTRKTVPETWANNSERIVIKDSGGKQQNPFVGRGQLL